MPPLSPEALTPRPNIPTQVFRTAAGVVIVVLIAIAPLNFGSTRQGGAEVLWAGNALAGVLWCASLLTGWKSAYIPRALALFAGLFATSALVWASGLLEPTSMVPFTASHLDRILRRWPTSVVWWTQDNLIGMMSSLILVVFAVTDLARSRRWRVVFALAITLVGVAVTGLSIAQNLTDARSIYWETGPRIVTNFAGPFYHHTTAGAYFNTVWPVAITLAWMFWGRRRKTPWGTVAAAFLTLTTIAVFAGHGSHVSRMPQVVGAILFPILVVGVMHQRRIRLSRLSDLAWLGIALGVVLCVGSLYLIVKHTGKLDEIEERWRSMLPSTSGSREVIYTPSPPEEDWPRLMRDDLFVPSGREPGGRGPRLKSAETARKAIASRPWFGHGPSNWKSAASRKTSDPFVRTFFQTVQFTHQDVLQHAVEWGLVGGIGWWGILSGGLILIAYRSRKRGSVPVLQYGAATALLAIVIQSQWDFPQQTGVILFNVGVLAGLCWAKPRRESDDIVHPEKSIATAEG